MYIVFRARSGESCRLIPLVWNFADVLAYRIPTLIWYICIVRCTLHACSEPAKKNGQGASSYVKRFLVLHYAYHTIPYLWDSWCLPYHTYGIHYAYHTIAYLWDFWYFSCAAVLHYAYHTITYLWDSLCLPYHTILMGFIMLTIPYIWDFWYFSFTSGATRRRNYELHLQRCIGFPLGIPMNPR